MLTDRVALVTGSSRGIGRAIAVEFAARGADVVVNYHSNEDAAGRTAEAVRDRGREARVVRANVADPEEAAALVKTAIDELGGLDVLVNNAGIYPRLTWEELTWEEWVHTLNVNVGGMFNVSKAALPSLLDAEAGVVVNVTSMWSERGGTENVPYPVSKGAVDTLTLQMAARFAPEGLRVNAVAPGVIATDMNAEQREDESYVEALTGMIPQARFGDPEEVARVAAFLASSDASYVNGAIVPVDGALLAK